jgi:hypothetical protein
MRKAVNLMRDRPDLVASADDHGTGKTVAEAKAKSSTAALTSTVRGRGAPRPAA